MTGVDAANRSYSLHVAPATFTALQSADIREAVREDRTLSLTRKHACLIRGPVEDQIVDRTRVLMIWQKLAVKWLTPLRLQIGRSSRGENCIRHVSIATATRSTEKERVRKS